MDEGGKDFKLLSTFFLLSLALSNKVSASSEIPLPCNSPCLLVTTPDRILALTYDANSSFVVIPNSSYATALDYYYNDYNKRGFIFWTDRREKSIKRSNMDGTDIKVIYNGIEQCYGLAVDWNSLQLYGTDVTNDTIWVSDFEGRNRRIVISSDLDWPTGIALDPHEGLMFWNALGNTSKVEKSNLDGTQRFAMITSNLTWPSGITLDRRNKLVYWVDEFSGAIESVDFNGNNRTLLFQQNGLNFYSVSFISPYLFITGWTKNWIYKFDVFNGTVVSVISLSRGGAYGLVAYDSYRQTWAVTCPLPINAVLLGCKTGETEIINGTECRFSCKEESKVAGSTARRCTKDGKWSGAELACTVPVTNETGAVNVTEGESVSLNCTISGDGSYTWERRDKIEIENPRRQVKGGGRLLEITDTAIADSGVYICRVGRNSHTITLQVLVQVKVEMALKVENYNYTKELENKSSPQYKEIEQNFTAEMNLVYRNTPGYIRTDVLKMTKGSVVVDFNIVFEIITTDPKNETTINDKKALIVQTTIKEAEDGFVKRLKVSKVIPKTEPPEPNDVEIFDIKSDELSVRWKPSEDAETFGVRTYSVQYRAYGEKTYSEHNQTANTENADYSYRIKSLESETVYMIRVGAVNTYGSNFNEETGHETEPAPFAWWIIVLAVLGVLLILGILIGIIIYRRRRARERREQTETRFRALENQTGSHKGEVAAYHGENVKGLTYSFKNTAFKSGEMNWEEFPHENIKLLDELGSGAFGIVFKGELQQENGNIIPCAVKTLKPSATKVERKDLYNELEIMANVGHHPNLVNLIGACTQDDLLLVIIELAENGCLLDFLKQSRQQDGNNTTSGLTEHMKTSIAVDVARGMAHLARCRCIHRDLAARNVLLGKDYVAKVSDYGMARDVYEQLMYKKETQGKLPVKWMAVESLETYTFTMESDVWAYGVLLWEIESGGLKPYAGLSTAELIENLKNGYRMEKPNGCSDEMYQTMRDCWNSSPSARPNFDELIVRLESTITT